MNRIRTTRRLSGLLATPILLILATAAAADEAPLVRLTFRPQARFGASPEEVTAEGKVVTDTAGGGLLFLDRTGRLWPVEGRDVIDREETRQTFTPVSQEEMSALLRTEFGEAEIVTTRHYVLCSEAGREYARWAGLLFERLMGAFETHWNRRPLDIGDPQFPLSVVILKNQQRFAEYALADAGPSAAEALGYYSLMTNRVVMYDLTANLPGGEPRNVLELNRKLAGQTANVSVIVHEATHQIAFNCGLHTRLADNPFWLAEGMAMYFETPDLNNASGWRTVGQVNGMRLRDFKDYVTRRRRPDALTAMISGDERFQTRDTAIDNYAEAWTLTYFLIRTKRAAYVDYLATLRDKPVLKRDDPEERVRAFEAAFGPVAEVEKDMMRYAARLRER